MAEVKIPFMERWKDAMLSGQKTCTSRVKQCAREGDTFRVFGATFKIMGVQKTTLRVVAAYYYLREGCLSPIDFQLAWVKLHPRRGWEPDREVWVHFFGR